MEHRVYGDHSAVTPLLRERHLARASNDPDYKFLTEQIALNEKYDNLKTLSLNHKIRETMIKEDEAARKALENARREAKGLPPLSDDEQKKEGLAGQDNQQAKASDAESDEQGDNEKDPRTNFELYESAQILLDVIDLVKGLSLIHI